MSDISRRDVLGALGLGALGIVAAPAILRNRYRLFAFSTAEYSARAIKLVEGTVVVDLLNQFRFPDFRENPVKSQLWMQKPGSFTRADYDLYRSSGTRVFALGAGGSSYESAVKWAADWNGFFAGYSDWFLRIDDVSDFGRLARDKSRIGVMLTMQNADHFRTPDDVNTFFALGQRVSQLTYNATNRLGSGFLADTDIGLTPFGAEVVKQMNDVGMAVDVSHSGDRTTLDGIAASTKPVIFSHASCRALLPGGLRAKTDEMIRNMAKTGGVMGIPFLRFMLRTQEPVTIEHALDHFDHAVKLVGVEHVGIGSDMDTIGNPNPMGVPEPTNQPNFSRYLFHRDTDSTITTKKLDHPKRAYDLAEGLIRRKHSDADIKLMLGGNWARVLGNIWPA
ncbi:MAG: membrane dipeptidase [Gemmatimonadetes bacterium]|nr:membrane dipeptidase [Gemmatimonadota bacterium]